MGKFHFQCLNIDRQQFVAITKEQASAWICPACSNVTRRARSNENTPVRRNPLIPRPEECLNMSCETSDPGASSTQPLLSFSGEEKTQPNEETVTMDKIRHLFDEKLSVSLSAFMISFREAIREDVKEMVRSEMGSVLRTIKDEFTSTTDFVVAEQAGLRSDLEKCTSTIKQLEKENISLQSEINRIGARLTGIDKVSRNCNIELQAVPERKTENLLVMLKNLCDVVKAPVEDNCISACRRVAKLNNSSNRPRNIVVTFSTPRTRDFVLSAAHRYNKSHSDGGLRSSDLGIPGEPCRIYVTEHLSPEQKALHAATRKAAKERQYRYVWVKYGQIYVRKNDTSGAILIHNQNSLDKL